jgi:type II secretory pathway pseudopilin PulG
MVELMVSIAILAVLSGILVPNVTQARSRAVNSATQSYLRQVVISVETYLSERSVNQVDDLTFGALVGPCGLAPEGEFDQPGDPVNLANFGAPFPFPAVVNKIDADPSVVPPQGPPGCAIYKDSRGGYGVIAQAVTKDVHTLYNGRLCSFKTYVEPPEVVPARPEDWVKTPTCQN